MNTFADRLTELRKAKHLTMVNLAEILECSYNLISMYESGKRMPSRERLEAIADYFNVDMDYLLGKATVENKYQANAAKAYATLSPTDELTIRLMAAYTSAPLDTRTAINLLLSIHFTEDEMKLLESEYKSEVIL